ncbi:WxcM-like domain-containing protein [Candidatus Giovannonibacteria bacterium]|nr:WxcM-like domain-containing protein [Candidatus Giovannonibacteria bacterium]
MKDPKVKRVGWVKILKPDRRGPWKSKSGGKLDLLFNFDLAMQNRFFSYGPQELKKVSRSIRGFRAYVVYDLRRGKIGGQEFHRLREEIVFVLRGRVEWKFEDLYGGRKTVMLKEGEGVWIPPYILHTYRGMRNQTLLFVLANTRFLQKTTDTSGKKTFRELRNSFR